MQKMCAAVPVEFFGKRVLIVDDNEVNRMVLVRTLRQVGMQTQDVASGTQALEWLRAQSATDKGCDMVLLDAQMPDMDGFTTATRIRQEPQFVRRCPHVDAVQCWDEGRCAACQRGRHCRDTSPNPSRAKKCSTPSPG